MVIFLADDRALLACDEGEAAAQFQDEALQLTENGLFQVLLAVGVGEAEEIQEIRIAEDQIRRQPVLVAQGGQLLPRQLDGLFRERRALEEHALDLGAEGADAPALDPAHLGVDIPLQRVVKRDYLDEVAPAQLSRQRRDDLPIREGLGEADHAEEVAGAEAVTEFGRQLCRRRRHNLFAVGGSPSLQDLGADAAADLPVEQDQGGRFPRWMAPFSTFSATAGNRVNCLPKQRRTSCSNTSANRGALNGCSRLPRRNPRVSALCSGPSANS
jgi:hypothetical protein